MTGRANCGSAEALHQDGGKGGAQQQGCHLSRQAGVPPLLGNTQYLKAMPVFRIWILRNPGY